MLFDDRLGTVLRLSASGTAVRLIQYRQLLDLLGISPAEARGDQLDAAYVRLAELAEKIPASDRAAPLATPDYGCARHDWLQRWQRASRQ